MRASARVVKSTKQCKIGQPPNTAIGEASIAEQSMKRVSRKHTGCPFDPDNYPEALRVTAPSAFVGKIYLPNTSEKNVERSDGSGFRASTSEHTIWEDRTIR